MRVFREKVQVSMFRQLTGLMGLAIIALLAVPAQAEPKFSFATTPGQLPRDVIPTRYAVEITPDPKSLSTTGTEVIDIEVRKPTRTVVLNALNLKVDQARLDGRLPGAVKIDPVKQTATITFARPIPTGPHRLSLNFAGQVNAQAEGLYYVRYKTDKGEKLMFGTQMEPTDARRMFPLWDEPVFRTPFALTVKLPENFKAVSNMPVEREKRLGGGLKSIAFAPTPKMPSYLLVLCAGELESLEDEVAGVKIGVVTTEGKSQNGRYAQEALKKLLPYYNDYFGVGYALPKLDQIAIPGGFSGAMENWGGITYNEAILLYDPARSSQSTKEAIFNVVAHEVAHQWFGNLVTMAWWDNLWLNEGFASWMDTKATDHFNPEWEVWLRASAAKNFAMQSDARSTTHPIQQPVTDPAQAASAFDEITYQKGEAFIRMLEAYLGEAKFRDGIRRYMKAHTLSNTTTADLWAALEEASGQPVQAIAAGWTEQPGFPVVTVSSRCEGDKQRLALRQDRFTVNDPNAKALLWKVPITYGAVGSDKVESFLLAEKTATTTAEGCGAPVKLNRGDTGYYRVKYEGNLFEQLKQNFSRLQTADRVNLLSDTWALVQAKQAGARDYLSLAEAAKDDTNLAVWQQILATLGEIDRLQIGQPGREPFQAYARSLLQPVYQRVGWDAQPGEPETTGLLRSSVLASLGKFKDEAVVAEARRRFEAFVRTPESLAPNLRPPVLSVVGRYADQATYDQLLSLARKTQSTEEKRNYYAALAGALDPKLAQQTLALSLKNEEEPNLATNLVLQVAGSGEHREMAWEFAKQNYQALLDKRAFFNRYKYLPGLVANFTEAERAQEFEAFAKANLPAEALPEVSKGAEFVRASAGIKEQQIGEVDSWACSKTKVEGGKGAQFCLGVN
ncbi:M1 family metallopeptidase [Gloeobacter morelensis MG652769]|uniref:Aminopeptidase n=2 Tax=Gloeobacter TaxID=33071 RepID=A0ABY3PSY1_9CYAN|nr:M1 family metallopeptidase [Gloeobacter morelensis MG652769]